MQMQKVLMVCTGNICRSVMAHAVLEQLYERVKDSAALPFELLVDSAGISDEEHGNPPDYRAAQVLTRHGWSVPQHRARQISTADLQQFSLILAMTSGHYRALERLARQLGQDRQHIHYYREYDPQASPGDLEVPDPWYGSITDFEDTLAVIERTTPQLLAALRN